jgi:hypothetical protein
MALPAFLITIDTEGDDLWSLPHEITTHNSEWLPRFQWLCEQYGLVPTYLTNYEMACCPTYCDFASDALRRETAEVGMHLHAWHSPPMSSLTGDDYACNPYLIEYPLPVIREKVRYLTDLLEHRFNRRITSHRAGRWAFDSRYARILMECGYEVDCSVTPGVSWRSSRGAPGGNGGPDYTDAPQDPYFLHSDDVCRRGDSGLLELPMTIMPTSPVAVDAFRQHTRKGTLPHRVLNRLFPPLTWLRPNGRNLHGMLRVLDRAVHGDRTYVEFMLHSSELMPGGSPNFRNSRSIDVLFDHMEQLFAATQNRFRGMGVSEFAAEAAGTLAPARFARAAHA